MPVGSPTSPRSLAIITGVMTGLLAAIAAVLAVSESAGERTLAAANAKWQAT